jgi:hypothetical protein
MRTAGVNKKSQCSTGSGDKVIDALTRALRRVVRPTIPKLAVRASLQARPLCQPLANSELAAHHSTTECDSAFKRFFQERGAQAWGPGEAPDAFRMESGLNESPSSLYSPYTLCIPAIYPPYPRIRRTTGGHPRALRSGCVLKHFCFQARDLADALGDPGEASQGQMAANGADGRAMGRVHLDQGNIGAGLP